jgi:hypothetical protein
MLAILDWSIPILLSINSNIILDPDVETFTSTMEISFLGSEYLIEFKFFSQTLTKEKIKCFHLNTFERKEILTFYGE